MTERTHWDGCWKDPAHYECAAKAVEQLLQTLLQIRYCYGEALERAEQDEAELQEIAGVLPGVAYMDPPDGGSPSIAEQVRRMRADLDRTVVEVERLVRAADTLRNSTEEYESADGMGRFALLDCWHEFDEAVDAARGES